MRGITSVLSADIVKVSSMFNPKLLSIQIMNVFKLKHAKTLALGMTLTAMLTGCDSGPSQEQILATAQTLTAQDASLNEIYQRSCKNCHTLVDTGAPLTGDQHEWAKRLEKGKEALVNNVIYGFGGMPPFGLCMECGPEEFEALVDFMAQQ